MMIQDFADFALEMAACETPPPGDPAPSGLIIACFL